MMTLSRHVIIPAVTATRHTTGHAFAQYHAHHIKGRRLKNARRIPRTTPHTEGSNRRAVYAATKCRRRVGKRAARARVRVVAATNAFASHRRVRHARRPTNANKRPATPAAHSRKYPPTRGRRDSGGWSHPSMSNGIPTPSSQQRPQRTWCAGAYRQATNVNETSAEMMSTHHHQPVHQTPTFLQTSISKSKGVWWWG